MVFSSVTLRIMLPPPMKGGIASSNALAIEDAAAHRPEHLVTGEGEKVDNRAPERRPAYAARLCAPSTSTSAPAACAFCDDGRDDRLMVPRALETCVTATSFGSLCRRASKASMIEPSARR